MKINSIGQYYKPTMNFVKNSNGISLEQSNENKNFTRKTDEVSFSGGKFRKIAWGFLMTLFAFCNKQSSDFGKIPIIVEESGVNAGVLLDSLIVGGKTYYKRQNSLFEPIELLKTNSFWQGIKFYAIYGKDLYSNRPSSKYTFRQGGSGKRFSLKRVHKVNDNAECVRYTQVFDITEQVVNGSKRTKDAVIPAAVPVEYIPSVGIQVKDRQGNSLAVTAFRVGRSVLVK